MAEGYVDNPYNIQEIMPWIITGKDQIISEIFFRKKCCFYDACSFRRHSKLKKRRSRVFTEAYEDSGYRSCNYEMHFDGTGFS